MRRKLHVWNSLADWTRVIVALFATLTITACSTVASMSGPKEEMLPIMEYDYHEHASLQTEPEGTLRVMTLNLAHGRSDGPHQIFQNTDSIAANLQNIAHVICDADPHVVAFQEADAASFWSGNFSHVDQLATHACLLYSAHGEHVKGNKLSYGTAISSLVPMSDPVSYAFSPSPPTFTKGFVVSTIEWPGMADRKIDVVSLHLDFLRRSVREGQVDELVTVLQNRTRPLIVMGDFNADGRKADDSLCRIIERLGLRAYDRGAADMVTFDKLNKRLDWILISPELDFASYEVLQDTLSDHKAVVSELVWVGNPS